MVAASMFVAAALCLAASASDVVVLTGDNFDESLAAAGGTWFVEFYAPWCGHCKKLAPTWEEVATELKGDVSTAKVDATAHKPLTQRFGVRGYPTLLLMKDGKMQKYSGARSKDALVKFARSASPSDDMPKAGEKAPAGDVRKKKGQSQNIEDLLNPMKKTKEQREKDRAKKMADAKKEVADALAARGQALTVAINTNNLEDFLEMFTDEPVVMMPGQPALKGPRGLKVLIEAFAQRDISAVGLASEDVELPDFMFKKTAVQRGTYTMSSGTRTAEAGNFLAYWEREKPDSDFQIKTLMFADDGTAGEAAGGKKEL